MSELRRSCFLFLLVQVTTVKINNVSSAASVKDIEEFFSFSGHIEYIEMQRSFYYPLVCLILLTRKKNGVFSFGRESEMSQLAYVTFKDSQGADNALLLSVSSKF